MAGGGWGGNTGSKKAPTSGNQLRAGGWGANAGTPAPVHHGRGGILGLLEGGAHFVAKKAERAASDIKNIPGGLIDTAEGLATHPVGTLKQLGEGTLQSLEHPLRDPFITALTIGGLAGGAGSILGRAAAAGDVAAEGGDAAAILKAAVKRPPVKARLIRVGDQETPLHASRNPIVRAGQGVHDRVVQKAIDENPEGRVASYGTKRVGGAQDETARYQQRMREAPAAALDQAAKRLTSKTARAEGRVNQAALELTSVNTTPERASAYHLAQAEKGIEPARNRVVAKLYQTVADRGLLSSNEHGDVIVNAGDHPKLAEADIRLAKVQGRGDEILTRYGIRTPDELQHAINAPGRYREGAVYVKPTPGKLGVPSDVMKRETMRLGSLERRHSDALAKDAEALVARRNGVDRLTATQPGETTVRTTMGEQAARSRLDELDQQYEEILKKFAPEVNPYSAEEVASETRSRNTMRGRMAQGKKPATGRAIEGRVGGGSAKIKTVSQEVRDMAEAKLHDVIAANPDHPVAQRAAKLIADRDRLRNILNGRAEATFAGEAKPALPTIESTVASEVPVQTGGRSIPLDNPHRERIVTLGHAIEEQKALVSRMQKSAAARIEPTGVIGGETARSGRGHVSYASSEKRAPSSPAASSSGPVVGEARAPITSHANTGFNIERGQVPADVTGGASRHFRAITRFENTTERRNLAIQTGSSVRRSARDVLVKKPGEDHAQLSHAVNEALGREKPTVDELHGLNAALDAYREQLVPGLADNFAADTHHAIGTSAADAAAERGLAAPNGYVWVDRNVLGDLGKPGRMPRGRIARTTDNVNSAVTAATVYFKIGHVGTRVLTNAATNLIQGSADPLALAKSLQLWHALSDEEKARALAAAGQHGFAAMPHEGASRVSTIAGKGANWWAKHADAPFRFNSIAYEARKAGFDTPEKFRDMLDRLERPHDFNMNAAETAKVDWVAKHANRAQIAYDRLNATERNYITRGIWFYPWIKGATMFAGHTLAEHPFKAAALGAAGQEGRQAQQRELGDLPSYEQGLFRIGGAAGGKPRVADFSTFSPFATPADVLDAIARPGESSGFLNPVYGAGTQLAYGLNAYGGKSKSPIKDALATLFSPTPEAQILTAYLNRNQPQGRRMFPASPALSGTLSPLLRALIGPGTPRRLNVLAGHSAAARERSGR